METLELKITLQEGQICVERTNGQMYESLRNVISSSMVQWANTLIECHTCSKKLPVEELKLIEGGRFYCRRGSNGQSSCAEKEEKRIQSAPKVEPIAPKLRVTTMEQKIIFLCEMQGQISDGFWENATPYNHYKQWCSIKWDEVVVDIVRCSDCAYLHPCLRDEGISSNDEACDEFAPALPYGKSNYNFANRDLLEVVGERLLFKLNLYKKYGKVVEAALRSHAIPDSLADFNSWKRSTDTYFIKRLGMLEAAGVTEEMLKEVTENPEYTMKDLRKDCNGLKQALKRAGGVR